MAQLAEGKEFLRYLNSHFNGQQVFRKTSLRVIYNEQYTASRPEGRRTGTSFSSVLYVLSQEDIIRIVYRRNGNHQVNIEYFPTTGGGVETSTVNTQDADLYNIYHANCTAQTSTRHGGMCNVCSRRAEGTEFLMFLHEQRLTTVVSKAALKRVYEVPYTKSKLNRNSNRRPGTQFSQVFFMLRRQKKVRVRSDRSIVITAHDPNLSGDGAEETEIALPEDPVQKEQMLLEWMNEHRGILVRDKFDIEVSCELDGEQGNIIINMERNRRRDSVTQLSLKNTGYFDVVFLGGMMMWKKPQYTLKDAHRVTNGVRTHTIGPGAEYSVELRIRPIRGYTRHYVPVVFHFRRQEDNRNFHIARFLSAGVTDDVIRSMRPTQPYSPPQGGAPDDFDEEVDGVRPEPPGRNGLEMGRLDQYPISHDVRRQIRADNQNLDGLRTQLSILFGTFQEYGTRFGKLLHAEEIQMEVDIRMYDLERTVMGRDSNPRLLTLQVPGLAENRPSVLKGDHLFAYEHPRGQVGTTRYKGYVHHVELNQVKLGFHRRLLDRYLPGKTFDVRFTFSRLPLQLQHRAVRTVPTRNMMEQVLFPEDSSVGLFPTARDPDEDLNFFDRMLRENEEQNQAVRHIVAGTSRPAPYLIFGPPGTGKTMTTVEAIKQVYRLHPKSVILACAPSNSAADLLAQRIIREAQIRRSLFRMNAPSRSSNTLPQDLRDARCCNYDTSGEVYFPSKEEIMQKYRIVVTTVVTAGRLASANFPPGHFTHVFIDESGHAVEPEAVIPVAGLLSPESGGQLVLAGDPKQLGPVLRSPVAIACGLGMSLLERLMTECPVYKPRADGQYDSRVLTKLVRNYRSHPAIIEEPNEQFYDGELEVYADPLVRESLCRWEHLPTEDFPVIFHGVEGEDKREGNSPSFFNAREVATVLDYVHELLNSRGTVRVNKRDIGIISPYRRQVQKIQQQLRQQYPTDHAQLKVGSVEEFQGQERLVIIVTTVRSPKLEFLRLDKEYNLGFLNNPKRFNVAITRAKALLIVVGNPHTLCRDEHWKKLVFLLSSVPLKERVVKVSQKQENK
ncbi:PREDICTED: putative helicase mov-10-B.1 [Branchiostoma belcheri]|uniref:RNA helicase n=1 Tax=Branchiostoma belcheri TaxID=7741 RepID=A0A6P4ZVB1_BRABE|nr:PREDICTED: putative helicase mov-10-B.1 [Branchiostoma belcheri]